MFQTHYTSSSSPRPVALTNTPTTSQGLWCLATLPAAMAVPLLTPIKLLSWFHDSLSPSLFPYISYLILSGAARCILFWCIMSPAFDLHTFPHSSHLEIRSITDDSFLSNFSLLFQSSPCPVCCSHTLNFSMRSFTDFFHPSLSLQSCSMSVQSKSLSQRLFQ